jgi:PAS domain S-box-containing protein
MRYRPKWLRALGNTADGVFVVDAAQRILLWNRGAERLLGYSEAEVLNRHCYEVIGGRLRSGKLRLVQNYDMLTSTVEGQEVWVNVSIIALPNTRKPLTVHLLRDITRRERSEQAMEHILRTLKVYGVLPKKSAGAKSARRRGAAAASQSEALPTLTPRELEVLGLLARGLTTKSIAERLGLSRFTVRNHVQNVLSKLRVGNRTQAVSFALRHGLL